MYIFAAVQFQICIQNRYKLNKKMRRTLELYNNSDELTESLETKEIKAQALVGTT